MLVTAGGLVLALMIFWPKVAISVEPLDGGAIWFYTLRNDSLLPITELWKPKTVPEIVIRPCIALEEVKLAEVPKVGLKSACGGEYVPMLRSGDAHTFRCLVPTFDPPTDQIEGSLELRVDYRYLRFFRGSTTACFEYAPRDDGKPRYIRRACSEPARTLPYEGC